MTRGLSDIKKLLQEVSREEEGCVAGGGRPSPPCYWPLTFPWLLGGEGVWGPMNKAHLFADMTFIHEGNHTLVENLINFEKMVSPSRAGI